MLVQTIKLRQVFLWLGSAYLVACNAISPNGTSTPGPAPAIELPPEIATAHAPTTLPPTVAPPPTARPTIPPLPTQTQPPTLALVHLPTFPANPDTEAGDIADACSLVRLEEVAALFADPPTPVRDTQEEYGYTISECLFGSETMSLSISSSTSPDYIDEISEHILSIQNYPLFEQFTASGAEVYQVGAAEPNSVEDIFAAIIIKGNIAVEIVGQGKGYAYYAKRETLFLKAIASRIPPETLIFNACDLVLPEEVAARFSNPPAPTPELLRYRGYSAVSCYYRNDAMSLTLAIEVRPDSIQQLKQELEDLMQQTPAFIHYLAHGADIYQWGGSNEEGLLAIFIKGENVIQLTGNGGAYVYDESREIQWMEAIASRLP